MSDQDFQALLQKVIEELTDAIPHLVDAQSAMQEAWSRITSRDVGDPGGAMQTMIEGLGGLLTWVENVKKGTE